MSEVLTDLIRTAQALVDGGLVRGAGGNVSAREGDVMWISPSGFSFSDATEGDYPGVSIEKGEVVRVERRPSSEVLMHLAIYRRRPEVTAVIHTHPPLTIAIEEQATIQHAALQVGTPTFLTDEECRKLDQLSSESYRRDLLRRMKQ